MLNLNQEAMSIVIGNEVAEKLFGTAERAVGKVVTARGKKLQVIGVIKKQGKIDDRRMEF